MNYPRFEAVFISALLLKAPDLIPAFARVFLPGKEATAVYIVCAAFLLHEKMLRVLSRIAESDGCYSCFRARLSSEHGGDYRLYGVHNLFAVRKFCCRVSPVLLYEFVLLHLQYLTHTLLRSGACFLHPSG